MFGENQEEAGISKIPEENGTMNELPALYANELRRHSPYGQNSSPMKYQEKNETFFRAQGIHEHDFNATIPENRSYVRWKSKNNHLLGNRQCNSVDMVSDLGRKLESSRATIVHSHEANRNQYTDEEGIEDDHPPVYSTPHNKYYGAQIMTAVPEDNHSPYAMQNPRSPGYHPMRTPFKGDGYSRPSNRYNAQVDLCQNNTMQGFDSRQYYERSPGFRGHDYTHYNTNQSDNCTNRTPKGFASCDSNCTNPKCQCDYVRKCCCQPVDSRSHCMTKLNRDSKSEQTSSKKQEMSLKRLYRIVWLQNEQLALLQKQIDKLTEGFNKIEIEENKVEEVTEDRERVSIGVMTSFIDKTPDNPIIRRDRNTDNKGTPGTEIDPNDLTKDNSTEENLKTKANITNGIIRVDREESFTLHGIDIPPIHIPEDVHSPQTSFHLDINEYKDSSSSSSSSGSDEEMSDSDDDEELPPVGWTFYDSVVGQVNNMLTKSNDKMPVQEEGDLEDVRNATFDQLRQLGVSFVTDGDNHAQKRVTFNRVCFPKANGIANQQKSIHTDSDTSMHINALAMKYLKGAQHQLGKSDKMQGLAVCNVANNGTNLSFATLRYLERYQLVPAAGNQHDPPPNSVNNIGDGRTKVKSGKTKHTHRSHKTKPEATTKNRPQSHCSNILDITAIKQQPKLLPKKVKST